MALRINLYHEIQRARKEEQYDPLKISFICLGVVALGLAGWYFAKLSETNTIRDQYAAHQAEMAKLEPQSAQAKKDEESLTTQLHLSENMTKRIEERFYWSPVMELISKIVPKNVQITKLTGDANSPEIPRRIGMSVDGIAAGEQPRKAAEDIRLALIDTLGTKFKGVTATFKNLDDSIERVNIDGTDYGTSIFSIAITFSAVGPDPAPVTPAPKTAKR